MRNITMAFSHMGQSGTRLMVSAMMIISISFLLAAALNSGETLAPCSMAANTDGTVLYVSQSAASRVDAVDIASGASIMKINLPSNPSGLVLAADGKTLYVTGDGPDGCLMAVDTQTHQLAYTIPLGHSPMSPVLDPSGNLLFVCNRFSNEIIVANLSQRIVMARIPVQREPIACALSPDGAFLFVANHLPTGSADKGDISADVEVIDTNTLSVAKAIKLPNGSSSLRGICVSPDGEYVYVTHILARYTMPTTQLERGWMNTNAVSILDARAQTLVNTVLLDDLTKGAANPWAIACAPDGRNLFVTHAGTDEVSIIDRVGLHEKLKQLLSDVSFDSSSVPNTLSFLGSLRRRAPLSIKGSRSCVASGSKLIMSGYFTDNIEILDLSLLANTRGRVIALGSQSQMDDTRRGEMLFNDADLCFQQWQSCASCHPDGRTDGLNWDLLNDGLGNPKSTKSMLLAHQTPPVMSLGVRDRAETAVRSGIKFIQFATRPEEDALAIDAYLRSLAPVTSPHLHAGSFSESAVRGKVVFEEAGCSSCHSGVLLTNLQSYNLDTTLGIDSGKPVDTPTLVEAWRTAPYLHDGRAATIKDMLTIHNPDDKHGRTSNLSPRQLDDLVDFIMSQ